jgi:hypothetical protein
MATKMPELSKRQTLTNADLGSLESYCIATGGIRELEKLWRAGIDPKLPEDHAIKTARTSSPLSSALCVAANRSAHVAPRS